MRIGRLRIDPVHDGRLVLSPEFQYRDSVAPERWSRHRSHLDGDGKVVNEVGGYLVRGLGDRVVLVDCGIGPSPQPPWRGGGLPASLARLSIDPSEVTDVVFTHLHFDHIGWTGSFDQARFHAHRADWAHFFTPDYEPVRTEGQSDVPYVRLGPVADRVSLWDSDGELFPGLLIRCAPGHTPGSSIVELRCDGERGWLIGDVAHNPVELLEDDWPGVADHDPAMARATATSVARQLVDTRVPFAAAHFAQMQWGRLARVNGRRQWVRAG
jgi:glyoxylase-like metal-dependent hydrolase (beta-lactamase superfamily II)